MFGKINFTPTIKNANQKTDTTSFLQNPNKIYPPKNKPIAKHDKNHKNTKISTMSKHTKNNKSVKFEKQQLRNQLQGSKFRLLNQFLYTSDSVKAFQHFQDNQHDFQTYHQGFRNQTLKWQINPLDIIIEYLSKRYINKKNKLILDLGCGDGRLHQQIMKKQREQKSKGIKVRSFDLISSKPHIQVADSANLPIKDNSADACVFCLSLMGINYLKFIQQARRVLKKNESQTGQLLIAQVQSRSNSWKSFVSLIQSLGFICFKNQTIGKPENKQQLENDKYKKGQDFFRIMYFKIDNTKPQIQIPSQAFQLSQQLLGGCFYKRR